ncbi:MAG: FAD-dependent thymidylate synthase [Burkholderiales bacterium]|nr:FAD-dependent thymidylate synthase [Burkholderiales bacterium]
MNSDETGKISLLDHGFVRLVDFMGTDLSVVRAARVSYDAAWRAGEDTGSDKRLIGYLWRNKHMTPFEAVEFQFEVKAPIFVLRQWHRHRTWSFNELSARYRELPEEFYVPRPEMIGTQSSSNKQMREIGDMTKEEMRAAKTSAGMMKLAGEGAFSIYRDLIARGVPRELARSVLPTSTYSHMFAKTNLRNLLAFCDLRDHSHAQHEIRVYAQAMIASVREVVPVCIEAWEAGR